MSTKLAKILKLKDKTTIWRRRNSPTWAPSVSQSSRWARRWSWARSPCPLGTEPAQLGRALRARLPEGPPSGGPALPGSWPQGPAAHKSRCPHSEPAGRSAAGTNMEESFYWYDMLWFEQFPFKADEVFSFFEQQNYSFEVVVIGKENLLLSSWHSCYCWELQQLLFWRAEKQETETSCELTSCWGNHAQPILIYTGEREAAWLVFRTI